MRSKLALALALGFLLTVPTLAHSPGALATLFTKDPAPCSIAATPSLVGHEPYSFRQTCNFDHECFCPADTTCTCINNVCQVDSGSPGSGSGGGLSPIDCNGYTTFCNQTSECGYCPTAGTCINHICHF